VLVIAQGVKMLLCGLLFDHVLTFYCSRPLSRIVGAVLYAFCGFLMLWGQHYWIGASIVMATLMMLMLELLMQSWSMPRFWGLAVASAVSIIMSTYSGFAVMLFSLAYALLRIPVATDSTGMRSYLSGFWRLALPVACGVLISCVTLVPYGTAMIQESSRVVSSGQAPLSERMLDYAKAFVPLKWLPYLVSRLLGNGLVSVSAELPQYLVPATEAFRQTNVCEMTQMGFSVAAIILLLQFAWWELTKADSREKILVAIASALCIFYCVNYFLPALSNVFSAVRYRASFALAAPICIAMAVAWGTLFSGEKAQPPRFRCWRSSHGSNPCLVSLAHA
jgi:MFS family permease